MRYRITIEEKGTVTYSDEGAENITWSEVGRYWARKFVRNAREESSQQVETTIVVTEFDMRHPKVDIDPSMRVLWSGHTYNIRQVLPRGPGDSEMRLVCTEVLDA